MTHHHEEEKTDFTNIFYLAGLFGGFFIGLILESGFIWVPIMGIVGLLFTAFSVRFWLMAVQTVDPELPSFIRSWNQFYGIVIVWLVLLIFIFWLITILLK